MKKAILSLALSLIFFGSNAQLKNPKAIDKIFSEWNHKDTPGGAVGIVKDGKLIYSKGYGIGDLEHDIPISPRSVFYIGSVSKQFVTFCILLLEEQGKLSLDDKIQKHFPDFPEYESPLTIRHFVHHTSGIRDFITLLKLKGINYLDDIQVDDVYELIKSQKELNFAPGEKYLYSNSCYFMLALIVEKASGQTIRAFAQEQIFDPLGMKKTLFYDDNAGLIKNKVFSYQKSTGKSGFDNLIMRYDLVGSGGIYSTIEDLFLWDQNFYQNKLGKGGQAIIEKMHENGKLNSGEVLNYAFAINNGTYRGLQTVAHSGSLAGYRSQLVRFPEQKVSVIILSNREDGNPTKLSYQVADVVLKGSFTIEEADKKMEEKPLNAETSKLEISVRNLGEFEGKYFCPELETEYKIFSENGILKVKIPHKTAETLKQTNIDIFEAELFEINFQRTNGKITGFDANAGRVKNLKFNKINP